MNCKICVFQLEDHDFNDLCACLELAKIDIKQFGTPDPLDKDTLIFNHNAMAEALVK